MRETLPEQLNLQVVIVSQDSTQGGVISLSVTPDKADLFHTVYLGVEQELKRQGWRYATESEAETMMAQGNPPL